VAGTIGILTSGGDCPGLNAVIRAAAYRAVRGYGLTLIGIENSTEGLLERPVAARELVPEALEPYSLRAAGTMLGTTTRGDPFAYPMPDGTTKDLTAEMVEGVRSLGLDALIVIGGDGSLRILRRLAMAGGIDLVGVPKTIDNDVAMTEVSVGFDTAMRVAAEALDALQPTAASHHRVMILEVMGRDAGHIALASGVAGGADVILIPEIPYTIAAIARKLERLRATGRTSALVIVAEGVPDEDGNPVTMHQPGGYDTYGGIGHHLAYRLSEQTGARTRVTVLGHLQRGAAPSPRDRMIASAFGTHAVDLVVQGRFDRMVAWLNRSVIDVPLGEAIAQSRKVEIDGSLVATARGLDISLGDEPGAA
jgi:ATP-dependent phosphofructokinase / diphosphate-dependent phosphofructokinase